jgi:Tol biopolymer transport system component
VTQIDDDTLLAYANGALAPARQAEVAALLERSPELAADLDALKRLQRGLRSTFDAADLLPAPGPAAWERVEQRIAGRRWRRLGIALSAGVCAVGVLILVGLALQYGGGRRTTAVPTPVAPTPQLAPTIRVADAYPAPAATADIPAARPTAVTAMPESAYPDPRFAYPPPGETAIPLPTSAPRWPDLALISGTLPIGRMAFTNGLGIVGSPIDPCWSTVVSYLRPVPTPDPQRAPEEESHIFVLNAGDQQPAQIADGCMPVLSPDGQRVAYSRGGHIFVINADGSQNTRVTNDRAGDSFPVWSPDGQRIAFARDGDGTRYLYVMNADGSQQIQLTNSSVNTFLPGLHYSWSPDGRRIAFVIQQGYGASIVIANADGGGLTIMPNHLQRDYWPVWSPDGNKIAFLSEQWGSYNPAQAYPPPGGPPTIGYMTDGCCAANIYIMNPDGSEQTQLTTANDGPPLWSPDGSKIAYISGRDVRERFQDLYVMAADGSQQTRLVTVAAVGPLAWSPDGQYLSFRAAEEPGREVQDWSSLAVLKLDGSQLIRLPVKVYQDVTWSH